MLRHTLPRLAALATLLAMPVAAHADITVGAVLSLTGGGASLGIPQRNTIELLPREVAGQKIRYVILDDGTDSTKAVQAFQKLVNEEKVDFIIGPSVTPTSLAVLESAGASGTPMVSTAGSQSVIEPPTGGRRWAFKLASPESAMLAVPLDYMKAHGGKTIGAIAFATAFGDAFTAALESEGAKRSLKITGVEKFNLNDTSVTPQALKLMAAKPDAIFMATSGTPGALPVIELRNRNFPGLLIANQGVANPDFLRVAGKAAEGVVLASSPVAVAEQLPANHPMRDGAMAFVNVYEAKWGANTRNLFGATTWDAYLLFAAAVHTALKVAQPGTAAFRTALRDAMETGGEVKGSAGIYKMTPTDHNGTDNRSLVMVVVKDGLWKYLP